MKIKLITLLLISLFSFQTYSQSFKKQNDGVLAYNLGINCLIGGIGGAINKKKGEKWSHAFLKNFVKGGLGGLVKYSAKYQTYYLRNQTQVLYSTLNRATFFLGHSITMNASLNERTFENLYFNYLGINMNYKPYVERGERFSGKLSSGTLISSVLFAVDGHQFNFNKTLEYGQFYFELDPETTIDGLGTVNGLAGYNSFAIRHYQTNQPAQSSVPHELVHTYQNYDFFALGSFYKKQQDALLDKSKLYRLTSKYIDYDYQFLFHSALYAAQPKPRYYKNWFEFEAQHFNGRRAIDR